MTRLTRLALLAAIVWLGSGGNGAALPEGASLIQGTSAAKVGAWELQAGGLVVREGGVGAAFATVCKGRPEHELAYFVLFKHRFTALSSTNCSEEGGATAGSLEARQTIDLDGKKVTLTYKLAFEPSGKRVQREELRIDGKALDVAKGRVLLVDLTVSPPRWQQKNLTLPATVSAATERKSAEALVKTVVAALVRQDRAVAGYAGTAGAK